MSSELDLIQEIAEDSVGAEETVVLLDENGELSATFSAVLTDLFHKFDGDKDGILSTDELNTYARACNDGIPFAKGEIAEIRLMLDCKTVGELHGLTLEGFFQLYHSQTGAREEDTWHDLHQLGYNKKLQLDKSFIKKSQSENSQTLKIENWRKKKQQEWDVEGSQLRIKCPTKDDLLAWLDKQSAKAIWKAAEAKNKKRNVN